MTRGCFGAIHTLAEFDDVQIDLEDPLLRQLVFESVCDHELLQLAHWIFTRREIEVLRQLLRDRRSAMREAAVRPVLPHGLLDSFDIDAFVLVEAGVFRYQDGAAKV